MSSCEKETLVPAQKAANDTIVFFKKDIADDIFTKKCITCHSANNSDGIPDYSGANAYATVTNEANGLIDTLHPSQSLLVNNHNKLVDHGGTEANRQTIIHWIIQGRKNN